MLLSALLWQPFELWSQAPAQSDQERIGCTRNLRLIYEAIQTYRRDNKELPRWLSDLIPKYVADATLLICPVTQRTGEVVNYGFDDPKLKTSYVYEFCDREMGRLRTGGKVKMRDWKRYQMELVGSIVPLVRCHQHKSVLNLGFDGKIYGSGEAWEFMVTNVVTYENLGPAKLLATLGHSPPAFELSATEKARLASLIPSRDPQTKPNLIDLTPHYNFGLKDNLQLAAAGNDLSALPPGSQTLAGVEFDVRGVVQLMGRQLAQLHLPEHVKGIKVSQTFRRLHCLHATSHSAPPGTEEASFVVHFANQQRWEIPIAYGEDVVDWWFNPHNAPKLGRATVAWIGTNAASKAAGFSIRLFKSSWDNPLPDVPVETLDYISTMAEPGPFLIAITVEP